MEVLVVVAYARNHSLTVNVQLSSGTRCLHCGLNDVNSKGSDKSVQTHRLV